MGALCLALCVSLASSATVAQQTADMATDLAVSRPAYELGKGPVVAIDAAHNNFHTADGRYAPFAAVLKNDGYRVVSLKESFSPANLKPLRVVVIANALAASNLNNWTLPTPSAFGLPPRGDPVSMLVHGGL